MTHIRGDIDLAVRNLILTLVDIKNDPASSRERMLMASRLLCQWDTDRGSDWYTSTKKIEEMKDEIRTS
jgi:hypothetical protein